MESQRIYHEQRTYELLPAVVDSLLLSIGSLRYGKSSRTELQHSLRICFPLCRDSRTDNSNSRKRSSSLRRRRDAKQKDHFYCEQKIKTYLQPLNFFVTWYEEIPFMVNFLYASAFSLHWAQNLLQISRLQKGKPCDCDTECSRK